MHFSENTSQRNFRIDQNKFFQGSVDIENFLEYWALEIWFKILSF